MKLLLIHMLHMYLVNARYFLQYRTAYASFTTYLLFELLVDRFVSNHILPIGFRGWFAILSWIFNATAMPGLWN